MLIIAMCKNIIIASKYKSVSCNKTTLKNYLDFFYVGVTLATFDDGGGPAYVVVVVVNVDLYELPAKHP